MMMTSRGPLTRAAAALRPRVNNPPSASRISLSLSLSLSSRRCLAGDAGDNNTGHITTNSQQGILFFNSILPTNLQWLFRLAAAIPAGYKKPKILASRTSYGVINPANAFQKALQEAHVGGIAEVVEVLPRYSEGAAFLKFSHDGTSDSKVISEAVQKYLDEHSARPWWNPFMTVQAGRVLGKPWVEDLARQPSTRLRVEFLPTEPGAEVAELSQEQLYSFFRPYGKLSDIVVQPSDSKVLPKYAYLDFANYRKAIMAKNCMHGYLVNDSEGGGKTGTLLRLTYEKKQRGGWIKDWLVNHPRIVIPLLVALIAGISAVIFDPIRTIAIKAHITRAFHLEDNFVFAWLIKQSEDLVQKVKSLGRERGLDDGGMTVVWENRQNEIQQIQAWLMESSETFIVVQGPRGSGKRELVLEHALRHKREAHQVLTLDCKPLQEARGDASTIAAAADQVGYRPVFSWINNISGLIDLAAQGMTGSKAGFSETLENQLIKIWGKTTAALKSIALDGRKKDDKDAKLSDDEYLDSHPERRPVVVIENWLHKNSEPGAAMVYDQLAEWAASLTTSNIAHVIFLTNDVSFSKSLSKALPDRVFRQISLGDCSPEIAKRYVIQHLDFGAEPGPITGNNKTGHRKEGEDDDDTEIRPLTPSQQRQDLRELDTVIGQLGGRLTDLEFFARRIKAGETPSKAVQEIIDQSASEILKMYLLLQGGNSSSNDSRQWTSSQAWTLVRELAHHEEGLRYNELLLSDPFKSSSGGSGEKSLAALEQAELISIQSQHGRPYRILPGKPVYRPAFQQLVADEVLRAKFELLWMGDAIASENSTVEKCEQELRLLSALSRQPPELLGRVTWLLAKVRKSQERIERLERDSGVLKGVLQREF